MARTFNAFILLFIGVTFTKPAVALNEWDIGFAFKDLTHRSISLEYLSLDPYRVSDASRRDIDLDAPVCPAKTIKEGLVNGTCNPVMLKRCGTKCVSLNIDPAVYQRASQQIRAYLREPCQWLTALKLGAGRFDSHPSFFYLSRNRAVDALGCRETPVRVESMSYEAGALLLRYR